MLGKILAREGNLDEALKYLQRAVDFMSDGKPTHASVGAAKFQQGVVYMLYGNEERDMEALRSFRDALSIAQMNEAGKGTQADSARVKWRMSQVMERRGMAAEAKAFNKAAEATKKKLLATGLFAQVSGEEELEYDSLVGLLYR
jgi:tetratricopeptide (TPR) repeat protein